MVALLVPLVAATVLLLYTAIGERGGGTPFSDGGPRNSAEAAALGDSATMLRLLQDGDPPERVHSVRPEIISSSVRRATTLEAAMSSRRVEMIRLLDREGAFADPATRHELTCLAADLELTDVVEYLAPEGPSCTSGEAVARVLARTKTGAQ